MKSVLLFLVGVLIALPALGADCTVNQGAAVNSSIGIAGSAGAQGACTPGNPGDPGNLIGFAFKLTACQAAFVENTQVHFQTGQAGDQYHLYLWRNLGGIPNDACGLECGVAAGNPLTIASAPPTVETFLWSGQACPCELANGETFYVGVVYATVTSPADWAIGRNNVPVGAGNGFWNTTGNHGAWVELSTVGFANRFGVQAVIGPDCGQVPVDETTWGIIKNIYR